MRADAVRTRKQLLDAAAEMFAERGADVSVAEIAERAGIGKGTVFRHFASKEDLIAAIVGDLLDDLAKAATDRQDAADATEALRDFMVYGVGRLAANRALCDVASGSVRHPDVRAGMDRLNEAAQKLVGRAETRKDLTGRDVVLLMTGVHQAAMPMRDSEPGLWRRYLGFLLDGLLDTTSSATHSRT
jgi:AcrR family transcriptional regulator